MANEDKKGTRKGCEDDGFNAASPSQISGTARRKAQLFSVFRLHPRVDPTRQCPNRTRNDARHQLMSEQTARTTISLDKPQMAAARKRARELKYKKFSPYVAYLIEKDLAENPDHVTVRKTPSKKGEE